jgi:microcystin-dependent protein
MEGSVSNPISLIDFGFPVGTVLPWPMDAYSPIPKGWLPCDGSVKDIADFPALYAAIGNRYGSASPTFLVPNLLSRVVVGTYTLISRNCGYTGGEETVTLSDYDTGMRGHRHYVNDYYTGASSTADQGNNDTGGQNTVGHSRTTSSPIAGSPGAGQSQNAHNNMQPYMRMQFIIKATL